MQEPRYSWCSLLRRVLRPQPRSVSASPGGSGRRGHSRASFDNCLADQRRCSTLRTGMKTCVIRTAQWFAALASSLAMAVAAGGEPGAVKLWPQLTPGIYNHANVLAMRCEVADDGLTVTDAAWDSYQVK